MRDKLSTAGLGRLLADREMRRFALFLAVGGLNTLVGYGFFVALTLAGLDPTASVIGATIFGLSFNFFSTGRVVFQASGIHLLPRFLAVYAAQCALNVLLLQAVTAAGVPVLVAQAIITLFLAVATFFAMRRFVFGRPARAAALP
jgi:putative flippase GtrA